jgi:hypothetical protein
MTTKAGIISISKAKRCPLTGRRLTREESLREMLLNQESRIKTNPVDKGDDRLSADTSGDR